MYGRAPGNLRYETILSADEERRFLKIMCVFTARGARQVCHASLAGRSLSGSSRTAAAYAPRRSPLVVLARGRVWGWPLTLPSRPSSHVLAPLTPLAHSTQRIKASGALTTAEILECASRSFKDKHFHGKPARWDARWWRRAIPSTPYSSSPSVWRRLGATHLHKHSGAQKCCSRLLRMQA
jgi:hypothetical protein